MNQIDRRKPALAASRTARGFTNYATLAGAAAAAAAGSAEAALYIETLNQTMATFSPVTLTVGQNGGPSLANWDAAGNPALTFAQYGNGGSQGPYRAMVQAFGNTSGNINPRVWFALGGGGVQRFTTGAAQATLPGANNWFGGNAATWQLLSSLPQNPWNNTASGLTGYIFFRFQDNGTGAASDFYYGWLEVSRNAQGVYTLNRWAYETVGGVAAQIGAPAPIPGGAGLAALAVGAAGLRGRRRKG